MRHLYIIIVAALLAGCVRVTSRTAAYMPVMAVGTTADALGFQAATDAQALRWAGAMTSLSPATVRVDIRWSSIEPVRGKVAWPASMDQHIDMLAQARHRIVGLLNWPPQWAMVQTGCSPIDAIYVYDWLRFVRMAVERYGDRVRVWEILNEPDAPVSLESKGWGCWAGAGGDGGAIYGRYVSLAAQSIRAEQPTATVLSGGLLMGCTVIGALTPSCMAGSLTFAGDALTEMGADIDGVAFHAYQFWGGASPTGAQVMRAKVEALRGLTTLPLWMTEGGYLCGGGLCSSSAYELDQASFVWHFDNACKRLQLQACIWYSLTYNGWRNADLMNADGTQRRGYVTLRNRLNATPTPIPYPAPNG